MSFTPFFKFPRRSDGLSLQRHYNHIRTVKSLTILLSITKVLRVLALKRLIVISAVKCLIIGFYGRSCLGLGPQSVVGKQGLELMASVHELGQALPAQLLDEVGSVLSDLLGELHHVDAPQDNVVGLHGVRTREGRARGGRGTERKI